MKVGDLVRDNGKHTKYGYVVDVMGNDAYYVWWFCQDKAYKTTSHNGWLLPQEPLKDFRAGDMLRSVDGDLYAMVDHAHSKGWYLIRRSPVDPEDKRKGDYLFKRQVPDSGQLWELYKRQENE